MSKEHVEKIKCPDCGKENNFTIWDSLNGTLDPQGKQQLLDGTLFKYKCPECSYITNIDYPILYHDMEHNVMVQYVHEDEAENAEISLKKAVASMPVKLNTKLRIVTSQNDLREKAIIFDNNLDDRVIEIIKLILTFKLEDEYPDTEINKAYFYIENQKYYVEFLGKECVQMTLPDESYSEISTAYKQIIENQKEACLIDINWALKALSEGN